MSPKTTPSAPRVSAAAPAAWTPPGSGLVVAVFAVVVVERLTGELLAAAGEDRDVEGVAPVVVRREQGEAVLDEDALVDGQARQLGGGDRGAVDDRGTPDERHGSDVAVLAAPAAHDLLADVDL